MIMLIGLAVFLTVFLFVLQYVMDDDRKKRYNTIRKAVVLWKKK